MALADVTNILKHDYKNMTSLLNEESSGLAAQLDKNTDSIHGDYAVIAMEVGREYGVGARLEGDIMPPGRSVAPQQAHVRVKRIYGRYKMTKAEVSAMETDTGAFVRAQPRRMKNLKNACARDYSREVWQDGSGKLAQCGTTSGSTTVVLAAATSEQALVNLAEGMQIDIGVTADPQQVASDRVVVSVNFTNATIVISGAVVTTTSSHFLFRQGAGGAPQTVTQRELTGVQRLIDGTLAVQDLDPANVWNWSALVDSAAGVLRAPSENLIEKTVMRHENRGGGVDGLWASAGVYRAMVNQLKGRQRVVNDISLKGGHTAVEYTFGARNLPLAWDRDADVAGANSLWGLEYESLQVYIQDDWDWEDMDGQVLRLSTDGTHSFEGIYYTFRELGISERNHNFRIDDLEVA